MNMIPGKQCTRVITTVILFLQEDGFQVYTVKKDLHEIGITTMLTSFGPVSYTHLRKTHAASSGGK